MSGAFIIGGRLVSPEELDEKFALGEIDLFRAETALGHRAEIRLMAGTVSSTELAAETKRTGFAPIGIGKPLTIEILTIYTGDAPGGGFLRSDPSLLVTSGTKDLQNTKHAPRAINQLIKKIVDKQYIEPTAFAEGSPVVYHSPAMVNITTLTSYELVVDSFDHKLFGSVSSLFDKAGGLPIFAPASAYLLAGSVLMKIFAKLGKALLESDPFLRSAFNIRFDTPVLEVTQAQHFVLYNDQHEGHFEGYKAKPVKRTSGQEQMRLVAESTGEEYHGSAPYIIASLNGNPRHDLKEFAPKQASAELLEDFYKTKISANTVEVLGTALELYNDFSFRQKAEDLAAQLSGLPPDSKEQAEVKKLLKAYNDNIRNDLFKLK